MPPSISICIPTYKQPEFLTACLESLAMQELPPLEVIISDDTPGTEIAEAAAAYRERLPIRYFHNEKPKGSPGNWNSALEKASGELVLLLHHDDYLVSPKALRTYAEAFVTDPSLDAACSRTVCVTESGAERVLPQLAEHIREVFLRPQDLVLVNWIGPPSMLMLRRERMLYYDTRYIWLVDLELYLRLLEGGRRFTYIDRHLVSVRLHAAQITNTLINGPIVLREHLWLARGRERAFRRDIRIYDHYWRLLRNQRIRGGNDLQRIGIDPETIPRFVQQQIDLQKKVPVSLLRNGVISKLLMTLRFALP